MTPTRGSSLTSDLASQAKRETWVTGRGDRLAATDLGPNGVGQGPVVPGGGQAEGRLEMLDVPRRVFRGRQHHPEVVVGLHVVGLDFQGLPVMGDGLVDLPAAGQGVAEVVVGLGVVGLDFQGLPVMGDGLVDLSAAGQGGPRLLWASA